MNSERILIFQAPQVPFRETGFWEGLTRPKGRSFFSILLFGLIVVFAIAWALINDAGGLVFVILVGVLLFALYRGLVDDVYKPVWLYSMEKTGDGRFRFTYGSEHAIAELETGPDETRLTLKLHVKYRYVEAMRLTLPDGRGLAFEPYDQLSQQHIRLIHHFWNGGDFSTLEQFYASELDPEWVKPEWS